MKKRKHLIALLLAGILALALLTSCGGGSISYQFNEAMAASAAEIFEENGYTKSPKADQMDALSEKYAALFAQAPDFWENSLREAWEDEMDEILPSFTWRQTYLGGPDGDETAAHRESDSIVLNGVLSFQEYLEEQDVDGTYYYYYYPISFSNPNDPTPSHWLFFYIVYLVP